MNGGISTQAITMEVRSANEFASVFLYERLPESTEEVEFHHL
jgi:hypothetical protein